MISIARNYLVVSWDDSSTDPTCEWSPAWWSHPGKRVRSSVKIDRSKEYVRARIQFDCSIDRSISLCVERAVEETRQSSNWSRTPMRTYNLIDVGHCFQVENRQIQFTLVGQVIFQFQRWFRRHASCCGSFLIETSMEMRFFKGLFLSWQVK